MDYVVILASMVSVKIEVIVNVFGVVDAMTAKPLHHEGSVPHPITTDVKPEVIVENPANYVYFVRVHVVVVVRVVGEVVVVPIALHVADVPEKRESRVKVNGVGGTTDVVADYQNGVRELQKETASVFN